jgi:hypothetical protein
MIMASPRPAHANGIAPQDGDYTTVFGALTDYRKGHIEIIDDDPKNYVFSNVFEIAEKSAPYERVVAGKNFDYVIEAGRAEGVSPWFANAHDEFILCMDGEIEVTLLKPSSPLIPAGARGAHLVNGEPQGRRMGRLVLRRGHQGLLPKGCCYRLRADRASAFTIQTVLGPVSVQKWEEICLR